MPSRPRSQTLGLKRKAETDSEQLRAEAQKSLQLDDLDGDGGLICHVLQFLGVSLIDFADTHPRPHQLVFDSPINYFEELESKLSVCDCFEILEKLFSKQDRGMQYAEITGGIVVRLQWLIHNNSEDHAALLPRVNMFVENLAWCSERLELDQNPEHKHAWGAELARLSVKFLSFIPAFPSYGAVWERFFHLSGIQLLEPLMHQLSGDPVFQEDGLMVLSALAYFVTASREAILGSDIFPRIRACVERWLNHRSLNEQAWLLVRILMLPSIDDNHAVIEDGVRLQVIENGLIPYMISFMRSTTSITSGVECTLQLLKMLCDPSQHFAQIQQSFLSSGGLEVLDEVIQDREEEDGEEEDEWIVLSSQIRALVTEILESIHEEQV